jgi:hypothetical protein
MVVFDTCYGDTVEIDDLDGQLLLGMDGRTSHADLAKAVGWSESTVRQEIGPGQRCGALLPRVPGVCVLGSAAADH